MIVKAVLFDHDGVIVDSDLFSEYAFRETLKAVDITLTHDMYQQYFVGRRLQESLTLVLKPQGKLDQLEVLMAKKRSFDPEYVERVEGYPEIDICLRALATRYTLAVTTGARRIQVESVLRKLGLLELFTRIVSGEDYTNGKPDPESYLLTLKQLGLIPDEAIVIEDAPFGIRAARAAGVRCIAVTHTHTRDVLVEAGATRVVDCLMDIPDVIASME